ncbi:hypothetical protein LPJ53_000641 [Coemansia erecta]|uniref:Zn(2)-C6 fungal-type domain-containing protein n=1 Tax=Coemansia erecta TaxID=147472 RepID=A0A9W7Y834_9FUNG|nr:hypothetical protein LPJ53_000641 [Coemansia erecta]
MTKADGTSKAPATAAHAAAASDDAGKMDVVYAGEDGNDEMNDDDEDDDEQEEPDEGDGDGDGPSKHPRLMRACDNCRRKKVKCNGIKPSCSHCSRMKLLCHYSPLVRKKRVRRSIIDKLEERLESMEQMLQPLVERLQPNDPVVNTGIGGFGLGFGFAPAPMPAIAHPLGMVPPGASAPMYGVPMGIPRELTFQPSSPSAGPALPPLPVIEEVMEIAMSRMTPSAPPVSWPRLLRRLHSGQLPEFIVCATIALGARFSSRPEFSCTPRYNAGREYAKRAAELIATLVDRPDPDVVLCMVMLSLYEWGCGRGESAWSYTGMATRLAQRCRLHLVDEEDFNENVDEQPHSWASTEWRRRLWWHVYCGDRTSVIVASRPATVHDDDCVVELPTHDHEWITGTVPSDSPSDRPRRPDGWWMVVEMYRTCSRISEFVNRRRRPVRKSEIPRRTMFDILDSELEDIRARFILGMEFPPPHDAWLFNSYASLGDGISCMGNIRAIYFNVHLMYHAAKIILYRSELPDYLHESIEPALIERAKNVCIDSAHKQADVIRWALDTIPIEDWDPKVGVWSLQGASIHVNAALSDDNAVAEQSRRDLEVHLKLHVASDQYYHFNMAIITMLHHVFNLRKKQRLAIGVSTNGAPSSAVVAAPKESNIVIDHENDADPWIVPRCSSFLGFTYNYSQLRGVLNDAIKQTTYSPPEAITSEGGFSNNTNQPQPVMQHSYHMSIGSAMIAGGMGMPSPLPPANDHRRMSADAATHSFAAMDLSGGLWHQHSQPTSAASIASMAIPTAPNSAGAFDHSGSLPNSTGFHSGLSMLNENMPLQQQIGAVRMASPLTPTGEDASAGQPRTMKRSFSSQDKVSKGKGTSNGSEPVRGRGRKPAAGGNSNGSGSAGSSATAAAADIPLKPIGTQQIEKLQRLEELRARVTLLQQLSGQNSGGGTHPNVVTTFTPVEYPSSSTVSPASLAAAAAAAGDASSKDVNGFLNNFAASIGSVASQLGSLPQSSGPSGPLSDRSIDSSSGSGGLTSSPPQQQYQQGAVPFHQPAHTGENAWLTAAMLSQPFVGNSVTAPVGLPATTTGGNSSDYMSYLQGLGPDEIQQLLMAQQIDPAGGMGYGHGAGNLGFSSASGPSMPGSQNHQGNEYSSADVQGLMQRLTTFNSGGDARGQ